MTSNKLMWHLDRLKDWSDCKRIAPLHIELGLTNVCNFRCTYCYAQFFGKAEIKDRIDLPKEAIIGLFNDAKEIGVRSITLIGEGEDTLSPYFYDTLKCARDIELDLGIATNGIPLKIYKAKEVLESFVWMRFSLGAANSETYKLVHGVDMFDYFIEVISTYINERNKNNLYTTIGLQMVVINQNMDQIVPIAKLGKELGVDYFVAKPCSDTPDSKLGIKHEQYLQLEEYFKEAETYATNDYNVIMKRAKFSNMGKCTYDKCRGTQFVIAIDAKGNVAPCGHLLGYRAEVFRMGNIIEQSFKDIVNSERYWEVQNKVLNLNVDEECETNCFHTGINVFLSELMNPPEHINFV